MLQLKILGSPHLLCEGREVRLPRKAVALLACLALEGRQPRDRLVELLWGSQGEARGRHSLRQLLYQIKATPAGAYLSNRRDLLELSNFWLDARAFLELAESECWPEALALYRGELLLGWELEEEGYTGWLRHWREQLGQLQVRALEGQAGRLEAAGQLRPALELYLELIRQDELQEHFYRQAMRLCAALGELTRAQHLYQQLCAVLQRELALVPLPETRALAEQIHRRKPSSAPTLQHPRSPQFNPPLVGRSAALLQLETAWQSQKTIFIAGPAGVGKSRLAKEFLAGKGPYIALLGQPGDNPTPYASMFRWMRQALQASPGLRLPSWVRLEVSRLLPELSEAPPPPLDDGAHVRFFTALAEILAQAPGSPNFLCEDAHFCDPWSLRALGTGLAQLEGVRLVYTFRGEELNPEVAERYRSDEALGQAFWLELNPLSEAEVAELVAQLSGRPARLFPRRLYQATAGNPLFVLETLRSLFESGELRVGDAGVWETPYDEHTQDYAELPIAQSVRQVILARLERQGAAVVRCLEVAALLDQGPFDSRTLAEAAALSDWEVCEALERAGQARLLEASPQGYRFSHELIARTIAEALLPDRRRLISGRLAQHYARQPVHPARVAGYLEAAGESEEAALWWLKAAQQTHALGAYQEADAYYQRAAMALPSEHPQRFEALSQRFYLSRQVGRADPGEQAKQLEQLRQSAKTALQHAQYWFFQSMLLDDAQDLEGALAASRRAYTYGLQVSAAEAFYPLIFVTHYQRDLGLLQAASEDGQQALALARQLSPFHTAEALLCHALTCMLCGQPEEALGLCGQAEALVRQHGPAPSAFWLLQERVGAVRARVLNRTSRFAEAAAALESLLVRARQAGVQRQELVALLVRAESWLGLGQTGPATLDLERALELARQLNWGHSETYQLYAELELALHNPKAALRQAERALQAAGRNRVLKLNALYSRGGAWLSLGRLAQAQTDLQAALDLHGNSPRFRSVAYEAIQGRLAMTKQ